MTGEFRVVELGPIVPLTLAAKIFKMVGKTCEEQGYEAFCKQEDGLGVIWARKQGDT